MPPRIALTDQDIDWLTRNHASLTFRQMARHIGCCPDTMKRILARHGLREVTNLKQLSSRTDLEAQAPMWTRPCLGCGDTEPRPKWWFFCRPCRSDMGYDDD